MQFAFFDGLLTANQIVLVSTVKQFCPTCTVVQTVSTCEVNTFEWHNKISIDKSFSDL